MKHHKKALIGIGVAGGLLAVPCGLTVIGGIIIFVAVVELMAALHKDWKK